MTKTNSQSTGEHLIIPEIDMEDYATNDATLDGTGDRFQSFSARLRLLGKAVTEKHAADTVKEFRAWTKQTNTKFEEMAGEIPSNSDNFINGLDTKTMANLATASTSHSTKIIHLEKEKHRWHKRFPELGQNLDKPPQKNAFLLGGIVLFLLAVESIANSRFFAEGSELGLLGGTLTAITVSFGNVFIPLGLAFFGHRWFHRYDSWRTFGIVMIGLFLLWAFGFNHLVAQYRESLVADNDASTLNYVLLFALGATVAGISFWKMWSFLDPFKQARKCLDDLERTKKEYEEAVCADLREAEKKCTQIDAEIAQLNVSIPTQLQTTEAEFNLIHSKIIAETNSGFSAYHVRYCAHKVGPDPSLPVVTPENVMEYNVGIPDAERVFFGEMKAILNNQIKTATKDWTPKLHDILRRINVLIQRFKEVITAKLLEWEGQGSRA